MPTRHPSKYCKLREGDILVNKYTVGGGIGRGRFSSVYSATSGDSQYAIKVYRRGSSNKDCFDNEHYICQTLSENRHRPGADHVIQYVEAFAYLNTCDPHCYIHPCIVYRLYGDSVKDLLEEVNSGMPIDTAKKMTREILQGLNFIHSCGIVHADIKASNVLLTKTIDELSSNSEISVVIADVGSSSHTDKLFSLRIGTQEYLSPEAILTVDYSTPTDIWSAMCLVYEIVSGDYLFDLDRHDDNSIFGDASGEASTVSSSDDNSSQSENDVVELDDEYMLNQKHLALIEGLLGPPPSHFRRKGQKYYNRNGQLRDRPRVVRTSVSRELIANYRDITPDDCANVEKFVMRGLCYLPRDRATAQELLADPWLN